MQQIIIQLLVFEGCPLADRARDALLRAMQELGLGDYEEIDILDDSARDEFGGWGSPTILVNGRDVAGHLKGDHVGCRLYDEPGSVPSVETIVSCIRHARS